MWVVYTRKRAYNSIFLVTFTSASLCGSCMGTVFHHELNRFFSLSLPIMWLSCPRQWFRTGLFSASRSSPSPNDGGSGLCLATFLILFSESIWLKEAQSIRGDFNLPILLYISSACSPVGVCNRCPRISIDVSSLPGTCWLGNQSQYIPYVLRDILQSWLNLHKSLDGGGSQKMDQTPRPDLITIRTPYHSETNTHRGKTSPMLKSWRASRVLIVTWNPRIHFFQRHAL